jgi:outer membrane lipoprotein carrier protein
MLPHAGLRGARRRWGWGAVLCCALSGGAASAETLDAFLTRLAAAGKATRSLQAQFVQRKRLALFRADVATRGRVLFQRPDRLRWETFAPDASVLIVAAQRAELRLPHEQPRVLDLKQGGALTGLVEQMMVWLGVRPAGDLGRHYEAKLESPSSRSKGTRLRLVPRDATLRKRIAALELEVGADLVLRQIVVRQKDGDTTTIDFSSVTRNAPLPADAFR